MGKENERCGRESYTSSTFSRGWRRARGEHFSNKRPARVTLKALDSREPRCIQLHHSPRCQKKKMARNNHQIRMWGRGEKIEREIKETKEGTKSGARSICGSSFPNLHPPRSSLTSTLGRPARAHFDCGGGIEGKPTRDSQLQPGCIEERGRGPIHVASGQLQQPEKKELNRLFRLTACLSEHCSDLTGRRGANGRRMGCGGKLGKEPKELQCYLSCIS